MEETLPEDPEWKKYEKQIHNNLKNKFSSCEFAFDESTNWKEELNMYTCSITRNELEVYLNLDFWQLRQDIKKWRAEFLENKDYSKKNILEFGSVYKFSKNKKQITPWIAHFNTKRNSE